MADNSKRGDMGEELPGEGEFGDVATPDESLTPRGDDSGTSDLADPGTDAEVAADGTEAEESTGVRGELDRTPDEADAEDAVTADVEQLDEATVTAAAAKSAKPRPVKRKQTVAPVRKTTATPKRDQATKTVAPRTTPALFTRQAIGELRKVVWPTAGTLRQYFAVVLVFVLFIMFFVAGLDALFGWLLLLWLG